MIRQIFVYLLIILFVIQTGCAHHPPQNLSHEEERARINKIAIVPARFLPRIDQIRPYGKMSGAREGAVRFLDEKGRSVPRPSVSGIFYWMLLVTAVGLVGAVDGAASVDPKKSKLEKKSIPEIDKVIKHVLGELKIQETMAVRVQDVGEKETNKEFIIFQDTGPSSPADQPDYVPLLTQGVDAVLELSVGSIGSEHLSKRGEHLLDFYINVQARLIRGSESYNLEFKQVIGPPRTYDKWVEFGAEAFQKEVDNAYQSLAEKIIEELFFLRPVPERPLDCEQTACLFVTGLKPVYPLFDLWQLVGFVDSLQPTLRWEAFQGSNVTYDLNIWRSQDGRNPTELICTRVGLLESYHTIETPLEPATWYLWTVRARYKMAGETRITQWATFTRKPSEFMGVSTLGLAHMITITGINNYRFRTP